MLYICVILVYTYNLTWMTHTDICCIILNVCVELNLNHTALKKTVHIAQRGSSSRLIVHIVVNVHVFFHQWRCYMPTCTSGRSAAVYYTQAWHDLADPTCPLDASSSSPSHPSSAADISPCNLRKTLPVRHDRRQIDCSARCAKGISDCCWWRPAGFTYTYDGHQRDYSGQKNAV